MLDRFFRLVQLLPVGRRVTIQQLADDLEVSYSTVQRDLDFLQDRICAVTLDRTTHGVTLLSPVILCPTCCRRLLKE